MSEVIRNSKGEAVGRVVKVASELDQLRRIVAAVTEVQKNARQAEHDAKQRLVDHRKLFRGGSPAELLGMLKAYGSVADALSAALFGTEERKLVASVDPEGDDPNHER